MMKEPRKYALLITRNFPPTKGGIETVAHYLCKHSAYLKNHKIIVLHFGQKRAGLSNEVGYHQFPSWNIFSTYFFTAIFIPLYVLKYKPDLIINLQINTALGTFIARAFKKFKSVAIHFGLEVLPWKLRAYNELRKILLQKTDLHLSISRYTDSLLNHFDVPSDKRKVIPLAADPEIFYPELESKPIIFGPEVDSKDFVCLSVGRLVPRKGFDQCIYAISLLKHQGIIVHYFIGGVGPDEQRLKNISQELNLESQVHFLGMVPEENLRKIYSSADVFLQPSRFIPEANEVEGFGLVYLEAGACGTPSIASKSGGIPDAILDGTTGLLVSSPDPNEMAEKIKQIKTNPDLLKELGKNAKERVLNELNWENVCRNYFHEIQT